MLAQDDDSESARKKLEAERLRAAEKFMVIGAGNASCKGCGYEYKPENGDPDFPIPKGMRFEVRRGFGAHPVFTEVHLCVLLGLTNLRNAPSRLQQLPEEYVCPVCGAAKNRFEVQTKVS